MDNTFIKPMYKPPKVTVVHFQIESGFAGSVVPTGMLNFFHDTDFDNTTAYSPTSNSGSGFWGGDATATGSGTSSYGFEDLGW